MAVCITLVANLITNTSQILHTTQVTVRPVARILEKGWLYSNIIVLASYSAEIFSMCEN